MFLVKKAKNLLLQFKRLEYYITSIHSLLIESSYRDRLRNHKNKFAVDHARKYFSQSDEDGLTIEILTRINKITPLGKFFLEYGVGNGCENNSLVLLVNGFKGSWIGGQSLSFPTSGLSNLHFQNKWITLENILDSYRNAKFHWRISEFDVVSLDLDGNDYHFISSLLNNGCYPKLFICEYNGIFPSNISWSMPYDEGHIWKRDQYFGASFRKLVDLFQQHNYFVCACNPQSGANAFFVKNEFRSLFPEIPDLVDDIYTSAFYRTENNFTHRLSPRFIYKLLSSL